jgi:uncharacterized membrane protein
MNKNVLVKPWYESKTLWVNIISLVVVVIGTMAGWQEMKDYAPELLGAVNVLNLVLRLVTYEAVQ